MIGLFCGTSSPEASGEPATHYRLDKIEPNILGLEMTFNVNLRFRIRLTNDSKYKASNLPAQR